jgi:hypothetical protein
MDVARRFFFPLLSLAFAACTSPADVGEECTDSADCMEGLSCFEHFGMAVSPVCMRDCDLDAVRLCEDGAVCLETDSTGGRPADLGVCYLGGSVAVGSACNGNLECVSGAVCVSVGGAQSCYEACSTDASGQCGKGEVCSPLTDMGTNGFCEVGTEG